MEITGKIVDIHNRQIYEGRIEWNGSHITHIEKTSAKSDVYILPGMTDAHVHIESSLTGPRGFAYMAMKHGTISAVADPHEIGNVLGTPGVKYMIDEAEKTAMKLFFAAPSCVPATNFENSGAKILADDIDKLLIHPKVVALAEMMNFPGVLHNDKEVWEKLKVAKRHSKPVDGHAPGLSGDDLKKYVRAGISTDHEATTLDEAEEKIKEGMMIQIREGSAAKNFDALIPLIEKYPEYLMFCTDDSHPDMLNESHILHLVKRGIALGYDLFDLLRAASFNAITHYNMPVGMLRETDPADFIVVDNLNDLSVLNVFINGEEQDCAQLFTESKTVVNNFEAKPINPDDLKVIKKSDTIRVIRAYDKELFTSSEIVKFEGKETLLQSDTKRDILKLLVLNRYVENACPQIAFISGFGLKSGALASSVAHDSHNIICVGTNDKDMADAVNLLIANKGGLSVSSGGVGEVLPLEIAGLMSNSHPDILLSRYKALKEKAKELSCRFQSPFMTLSFMALPVIPELKITDTGLFDVNMMKFTDLFV